jgi:pyruvate formate lyase activating enzyme
MNRRKFIKSCLMGGCGLAVAGYALPDFITGSPKGGLRIGFANDAPAELWKWSREADWYETNGNLVHCRLCPHGCILGENDRGFCRTRVVKGNKLHTVAYGNPCSAHMDPIEKKPLYHFLPGTPILSIATGGCNLRCLNCQNWEISQKKPEELKNYDLMPEKLVELMIQRDISSIAYTYSEPLIYYEYVKDTASLARQQNIKNVLVTAGYIEEAPLRRLCRVVDAANVDLKGFTDGFYKKVTGAKLAPVMRGLEIMREEGVWLEMTRLIVPAHSDDMDDMRAMCDWIVQALGPEVVLHLSRFHPAYQLMNLPPTPLQTMEQAYEIARNAGLYFVYIGNVPEKAEQETVCPSCGEVVIRRRGYRILDNQLLKGKCPCGERLPGVWL